MFRGIIFAGLAAWAAHVQATEPAAPSIVGTWKVVEFKDDGGDQRGRLGMAKATADTKYAKLVFAADECWVVRADGKRDVIKGLTNCGFKKYAVKPGEAVHQITLIAFGGIDGGDAEVTYVGILKVEGEKLSLCWNEEGADKSNGKKLPAKFESDGNMNLFVAERLSEKAEDKPGTTNAVVKK